MKFKVGRNHFKNFPDRFESNKYMEKPILTLELWFTKEEIMRISRDGFIMPRLDQIQTLLDSLDKEVLKMDEINSLRKWVLDRKNKKIDGKFITDYINR